MRDRLSDPKRVHSSLSADEYEGLQAVARDQHSSVSRLLRIAILEYLERAGQNSDGKSLSTSMSVEN